MPFFPLFSKESKQELLLYFQPSHLLKFFLSLSLSLSETQGEGEIQGGPLGPGSLGAPSGRKPSLVRFGSIVSHCGEWSPAKCPFRRKTASLFPPPLFP